MKNKRLFRRAPIVALVLLVLGLFGTVGISPVHAAAPTFVKFQTGTQTSITFVTLNKGDFLAVHVFAASVNSFGSFTIFDSQVNTYTQLFNHHLLSAAWWTIVGAAGTDTITIGCTPGGCGFSGGEALADQYTGVVSVVGSTVNTDCNSSCTSTTGNDVLQSSIVAGTGTTAFEILSISENSGPGGTITPTATSTGTDGVAPAPQSNNQCTGVSGITDCTWTSNPTASFPVFRTHYSDSMTSAISDNHADVILLGATNPSGGSATSCFGNCGNPAVTLTNANVTHTINFNQSITLFYTVQSPVNGFVVNETVNIAKPYINGIQIGMAIYTATCGANVLPFSQQCPGTLATSQVKTVSAKGQATVPSGIGITSGEWIAIAVTSQFQGLDLNQTNSICSNNCFDSGHLQYANGFLPTVLSAIGRCAATGTQCNINNIDNMGLWSFFTGTFSTVPTPNQSFNCPGLLDCVLPSLVQSLCSNGAAACIAGSALVWAGILSIVATAATAKGASEIVPTVKVPFGEIFLLFMVIWTLVMGGLSLIFAWGTLTIFLVVAIMFGKQTGHYL